MSRMDSALQASGVRRRFWNDGGAGIVLAACLFSAAAARAASPLFLPSGPTALDPGSAETARKSLVAAAKSLAEDQSTDVWIVQYDPEKTASGEIREVVSRAGAKLLAPVPGGAYLVRATKAQQLGILESGAVEAARIYAAGDKGVPAAASAGSKWFAEGGAGETHVYSVATFRDCLASDVAARLSAVDGCEVLETSDDFVRVRMSEAGHAAASALPGVLAICEWRDPELDIDVAVRALRVDSIWPSRSASFAGGGGGAHPAGSHRGADDFFTKGLLGPDGRDAAPEAAVSRREDSGAASGTADSPCSPRLGLDGKGQIVAVCDTGLDTGDVRTLHGDVRGRVVKSFAYGRDGDWSDINGHGSHVIGSVAGNGAASGGKIRGPAYEAEIVVQSTGCENGEDLNIPLDAIFRDLLGFSTPDGRKAKILSNSWGTPRSAGRYEEGCCQFDAVTFANPDLLLLKSAGNDGTDRERPFGVVDPGSISAPGASKNALVVGAAENRRDAGGLAGCRWGERWPDRFSHAPVESDFVSKPQTGERGMAAFSSRGPCVDGRVKPDVVAPGTDIVSARSSLGKELWGEFDDSYQYSGGTSMATPLVAGTAALVRQWLVERMGVPDPDAATMKALLCAGAKSLAPGQYGTGEFQEIPFTYPNNVEGWGMVDLENTVANPDGVSFRDGEVVTEGAGKSFKFTAPGGRPLCILMAYLDAPGMPNAGGLVNDLDLVVVDPAGKIHHPNSQNGPDRANNVEGVRWARAPAGEYVAHVTARSVQTPMDTRFTGGVGNAVRFSIVANGAR